MIALATGILLLLVHPGWNLHFLAPLALLPLFYVALREKRASRRFLWGYASGILYWCGACYWIQQTLEQHGGMPVAGSWALFVLFCLAKALQTGVFAWLAPFAARRWWAAPALAALWVSLEWTHNYTGFAWLVLGNASLDWPVLAKLAPITGVWGISFMLALCAAILVTRQWPWLALFAIPLIVPPLPTVVPAPLTALAVQPNLSEDATYSAESKAALARHLAELSVSSTHPNLIVWPEVPAPIYDQDAFLADIPRAAQAPLLSGVVSHTDRGESLNSALLLSSQGRFVSRYDKVNLVPFGEFVPWPFDAVARKVSSEAGEFVPGSQPIVAAGIGTFICYESVFPNYIRQFPLRGARVLFNLSNDSWFAQSAARHQHFLITRMRAIENRRWIVRVTNNGITASIDPVGQVHDQQPSYREISAILHYGEEQSLTLYTRWGDWFAYLCVLLCVLMLIAAFLTKSPAQGRPARA